MAEQALSRIQRLDHSGRDAYDRARAESLWNPDEVFDWAAPSRLNPAMRERAWRISSQSVYAEQAGMLIASELVGECADLRMRWALGVAVADEAKHGHTFARYAQSRGGRVDGVDEDIGRTLELMRQAEGSLGRHILHTMFEWFAHDEFRLLERAFEGDLLADIYRRIRRDEARHVALGSQVIVRRMAELPVAQRRQFVLRHEEIGRRIAGVDTGLASPFYGFMSQATGRPRERVGAWFERRHRARIDRLISGEEVI